MSSPKGPSPRIKGSAEAGWGGPGVVFRQASLVLGAGELRRQSSDVKAGVSYRARREEASTACLWRAVGDSQDGAARTPRVVGRPVGSKEPKEASRRVWDCGIRGGRERIGMGGEILAWPVSRGEGVCVCWCAGQHAPVRGRDLGGSECGWTGSLVGAPMRGRERESKIKGSEVCGFLCVCLRPCGSALEPPGTHRNAASLGCPGRPLFHKEVAARKKGGGRKGRNPPSPTRASNKGQFI